MNNKIENQFFDIQKIKDKEAEMRDIQRFLKNLENNTLTENKINNIVDRISDLKTSQNFKLDINHDEINYLYVGSSGCILLDLSPCDKIIFFYDLPNNNSQIIFEKNHKFNLVNEPLNDKNTEKFCRLNIGLNCEKNAIEILNNTNEIETDFHRGIQGRIIRDKKGFKKVSVLKFL
jgi:hypothetical protein